MAPYSFDLLLQDALGSLSENSTTAEVEVALHKLRKSLDPRLDAISRQTLRLEVKVWPCWMKSTEHPSDNQPKIII